MPVLVQKSSFFFVCAHPANETQASDDTDSWNHWMLTHNQSGQGDDEQSNSSDGTDHFVSFEKRKPEPAIGLRGV